MRGLRVGSIGMITPAGLGAKASCAALRAGINVFQELPIPNPLTEPLFGAFVPYFPQNPFSRICDLLTNAVEECLRGSRHQRDEQVALLVGVQEANRPDYSRRIERKLIEAVLGNLKISFRPKVSKVFTSGRASVLIALLEARYLLESGRVTSCIVAGVDSLINEDCVAWLYRNGRLRLEANLDGLFPGEGAGAIEITRANEATTTKGDVIVIGVGQATESASIVSGEPNLADGLTSAVKTAVAEGAMSIGDVDFRISDATGEEYYFRETANALIRLLRVHKEGFPLWHYADSIGDIGAASGAVTLGIAAMALRKGYAPGKTVICHSSSDFGQRAAALVCAAN